jgi:hypothetical protein
VAVDLEKQALRQQVTQMLNYLYQAQKQLQTMAQWKKFWIHPN